MIKDSLLESTMRNAIGKQHEKTNITRDNISALCKEKKELSMKSKQAEQVMKNISNILRGSMQILV